MKKLYSYSNGNISTEIYSDGTKIQEYEGVPSPEFPESIDVKITDYCDMANYCKWCHESSDKDGSHANDLVSLLDRFTGMPSGIELAIGGGNPLSHPNLIHFLREIKNKGFIANLTVNALHLKAFAKVLDAIFAEKLIYGLGISWNLKNIDQIAEVTKKWHHVVVHMIAGVNLVAELKHALKINKRVLILGYKTYGRGTSYSFENPYVLDNLRDWSDLIFKMTGDFTLCFDNLALSQLNIRYKVAPELWEQIYMGDDGTHSMYIDWPTRQFALTSYSDSRFDFESYSIPEAFQTLRNERKQNTNHFFVTRR